MVPQLRVLVAHDVATEAANLKLSYLSSVHERSYETLMLLQAILVTIDEEWARSLNREIWQLLLSGAQSRLLVLPAA